jgi:large subunit ribosomal protein L4e
MFCPTKIWRRWHRKVNINQKRYAVASALAASAVPALVMARGHKIDGVSELPLVVDGSLAGLQKTAKAVEVLTKLGAGEDVEKVKESKKLRAGKGKMRNRRYTMRRGPLIIYDASEGNGIHLATRNIPGVESARVDDLNLLQLAPGGHMGRFIIWTQAAFDKLDVIYGTYSEKSQVKADYILPRHQMVNADLARIINSDEIQSVLREKRPEAQKRNIPRKKNPLKNLGALVRLNPHALSTRRSEARAQAARAKAKAELLDKKRQGVSTATKEKQPKDNETARARRKAGRAFYEKASKEGDVKF